MEEFVRFGSQRRMCVLLWEYSVCVAGIFAEYLFTRKITSKNFSVSLSVFLLVTSL
jgi:hypothetical protein